MQQMDMSNEKPMGIAAKGPQGAARERCGEFVLGL
jgi:hypothetical protein